VFLRSGNAYIHQDYLFDAVIDNYGDLLTKKLTKLSKVFLKINVSRAPIISKCLRMMKDSND
jgi:hypothetical protein